VIPGSTSFSIAFKLQQTRQVLGLDHPGPSARGLVSRLDCEILAEDALRQISGSLNVHDDGGGFFNNQWNCAAGLR